MQDSNVFKAAAVGFYFGSVVVSDPQLRQRLRIIGHVATASAILIEISTRR